MHRTFLLKSLLESLVVVIGIAGNAIAVPYASGIRNTSGSTWEFVLNQPASGVTVMRDGGSPLNLGALAAGRYTFDMSGHSTFDIKVSNTAATAWKWVNNSASLFDDFERPTGMAVNSNPTNLAYFGTMYVNNSNTAGTGTGRPMGDGVYALSADIKGINANDYSVVADDHANTAFAQNWHVAGSTSSAWRMGLDDAGNVIISDWYDGNGGMKWASRDLTDGGPLLYGESGPTFGVPHPTIPNAYIHGSIMSKPYITGTLGTNLVVSAIDEDLESSFGAGDGDNLWTWNVGTTKDHTGSTVLPTLVMDGGNLVDGASSPTDSAGTPWFENSGGHFADSTYSPAKNRWYITGASTYGEEKSSLLVVDASGATPVVKWSSKQFSIDHGLDGMTASAISNSAGINDILRDAWAMKLSADGTKLYVGLSKAHRDVAGGDNNPYVGPNSTHVPGAILIIPLDANGLPNIQVSDNGTPGDTTDDYLTNVQSFFLPTDGLPANGNLDRINIDVDAAGNVYVTDNITEKLRVFSPGGNTLAVTSSNGTFNLSALVGLAGDFNSDGKVDAGDYVTWRKNSANASLPNDNGFTTQAARYSLWRSSFGTPGSGSGSLGAGTVPEPSTIGLAVLGMFSVLAGRRRRIG
jgi:hypothetical protein